MKSRSTAFLSLITLSEVVIESFISALEVLNHILGVRCHFGLVVDVVTRGA